MTAAKAKQMACLLVSNLVAIDSRQDSWLVARLDHLSMSDRRKVLVAMDDLSLELARRGDGARAEVAIAHQKAQED